MKKWKYENEIKNATAILLTAYLATMHSDVITAIYTYNNDVYAYDLTTTDLENLATATKDKLQINALGKKRIEKVLDNSEKFSTVEQMTELEKQFTKQNKGYLAEFLYRIVKNGETTEQIKKSNNSKGYDVASDTKDNKQLKNLDNKATFTTYEYLLKVCEKKNYKNIDNVRKAINDLAIIYSE